jgi:hypothetical protein
MGAVDLRNLTPFPNLQFANWDQHGREFGVFMVKTAWDIAADGTCSLSEEQEPFVFTDIYHGEVNESSPRYASDLVPFKPRTDIVLNATAFAPRGIKSISWIVAVEVIETTSLTVIGKKNITVTGPRAWGPVRRGWRLSDAEPITSLDLRYEYAFGGILPDGKDDAGNQLSKAFEQNPIGRGWISDASERQPIPAPQLLANGNDLTDPYATKKPTSLGPVPSAWLPRRELGGTYDQNWLDHVWPGWPSDYDFAFHNSASEGLACDLPMGAGIQLSLSNMHPEKPRWTIHVPDPQLVAYLQVGTNIVPYALTTDTVFLDIAEDRLNDPRVFVVSRLVFDRTTTDSITLGRLINGPRTEELRRPPHPHSVAQFVAEENEIVPQDEEELA